MPGLPSLSVIVICRNYARFVPDCLHSIFQTVDQPCELVFIDNGSNDDSVGVARRILAEAPEQISAKLIDVVPEQGLNTVLNMAIREATGEFIKPISADDMLGPNFFVTFRELVVASEPSVGVWLAGSVIIDEHGGIERQTYARALFGSPSDGPPKRFLERHVIHPVDVPPVSSAATFFRRKVWADIGGYDERFRYEDRTFQFDAMKRGWTIMVHPYNNTFYRRHSTGTSANPRWMAAARLPILWNHTLRAEWRNKPYGLYQLARNVRVVLRDRWRARREFSR